MSGNPHIGPSFEEFLEEDGTLEEVNTAAQKRLLALQPNQARQPTLDHQDRARADDVRTAEAVVRDCIDRAQGRK